MSWGLVLAKVTAMLCIGDANMVVKTRMQSTLAEQHQRRLANEAEQFAHVATSIECRLRDFVGKAGWQVFGLILFPFCKLDGLTFIHSMM